MGSCYLRSAFSRAANVSPFSQTPDTAPLRPGPRLSSCRCRLGTLLLPSIPLPVPSLTAAVPWVLPVGLRGPELLEEEELLDPRRRDLRSLAL